MVSCHPTRTATAATYPLELSPDTCICNNSQSEAAALLAHTSQEDDICPAHTHFLRFMHCVQAVRVPSTSRMEEEIVEHKEQYNQTAQSNQKHPMHTRAMQQQFSSSCLLTSNGGCLAVLRVLNSPCHPAADITQLQSMCKPTSPLQHDGVPAMV